MALRRGHTVSPMNNALPVCFLLRCGTLAEAHVLNLMANGVTENSTGVGTLNGADQKVHILDHRSWALSSQ